jgi:hypothetical protein
MSMRERIVIGVLVGTILGLCWYIRDFIPMDDEFKKRIESAEKVANGYNEEFCRGEHHVSETV